MTDACATDGNLVAADGTYSCSRAEVIIKPSDMAVKESTHAELCTRVQHLLTPRARHLLTGLHVPEPWPA